MSWWNVCGCRSSCALCTHPSCRGCLWRSTWGWRQCLDRKEVSACHSPPDPLCPREPTPPDGQMKCGQREEHYDEKCNRGKKGRWEVYTPFNHFCIKFSPGLQDHAMNSCQLSRPCLYRHFNILCHSCPIDRRGGNGGIVPDRERGHLWISLSPSSTSYIQHLLPQG